MSVLKERPRRKPEVNIIPLVDVLVVLIFFFLISMQFRNMTTLELTLPRVETAGQTKMDEQLEIVITSDGRYFIQNELLDEEALIARIREAAGVRRDWPVLLIADEESALRHLTRVMDICRLEGLDRIKLQSR
jgi:biopolymer transport protein ExbD